MARKYTLKRRAESQAETRQKIVEAAVELHSTVGPAQTTVSMIAERAGVQRHTYYAHFPDEWSLGLACSGLHLERNPPPNSVPWRAIADPVERLRTALPAIYTWYVENESLTACVLRDSEFHELTRKLNQFRIGPHFAGFFEVLGNGLNEKQNAMLHVALSFYTWRTLTRDCRLAPEAAVETMVQAIESSGKAAGTTVARG